MSMVVKIEPNQINLTDEQNTALAQEAYDEIEKEDILDKSEDEETEPVKAPAKEETEEEETEEPGKKPVEEQPKEEPAAEVKAKDEVKPEASKEDEAVTSYALKHDMTVEEAKEDIAKNKGLLEKYKNPDELARQFRLLQSERDRMKAQAEKTPESKPDVLDPRVDAKAFIKQNKDKLVSDYRERFPAKSEIMTDEAIMEEVEERVIEYKAARAREEAFTVKQQAADKRLEIGNKLTALGLDADSITSIKKIINDAPDSTIVKEEFKLNDLVWWAKGKRADEEIKKAREEGYKKGREEARILGEKAPVESQGKSAASTNGNVGVSLNEAQKTRAVQMYDFLGLPDEECHKMFRETYAKELKKDKNFIG